MAPPSKGGSNAFHRIGGAVKIGIVGPLAVKDIAHLLDAGSELPAGEMRGSSLLVSLIEALLAMGHEVSAFTTEPSLEPQEDNMRVATGPGFRACFTPLRRYGFRNDRGRCGRMLDLFRLERRAIARAIKLEQPDVVHAHWSYEFAWAALDSGLPVVVTCHDAPWTILRLMPDAYRFGRLLMARQVLARAQHLTAVSPYLLPELTRFTQRRIEVIANPIPDALFAAGGPRQLRGGEDAPRRVAMVINGWSSLKNASVGMAALAEARRHLPGLEIDLIGPDFGSGQKAETWAGERGIAEAFHFHGPLPYADVLRVLATADLLVHPSLEESFGMTVAEAMALGIPVVVGENAGALPWVTGEGTAGLLVDVTSSAAITEAVLRLLGEPALYARCSAAGRARAESAFSARNVAQAYIARYQAVLGGVPAACQAGNDCVETTA